ncbi:MAG TPA: Gfo/Idh/MocA family oxidoreductase, partial [Geobacteraceae bacterium]|nr:Gfo/Idh/MocA family oxidoreductase [Geobacteraceae bacterium]
DANVVWDLAPHDLSIMDYLIEKKPSALAASGVAHINGQEDIAYIVIYFPDKLIAHFTINWLSPVKIRTMLIGGHKKMLVWNDMVADEKIRIYDKGIEVEDKMKSYSLRINYRSGDMYAPKLEQVEALNREAEYFIRCISEDIDPINNGTAGLRVVKLLEAVILSLKSNGSIIVL